MKEAVALPGFLLFDSVVVVLLLVALLGGGGGGGRRRVRLGRRQQQWLVLALGLAEGQVVAVLQLAARAHQHLHVPLLAELAEHVVLERRLHGRALVRALVARAAGAGALAHEHVAVGLRARDPRGRHAGLRRGCCSRPTRCSADPTIYTLLY